MSTHVILPTAGLRDVATGALIGFLAEDGKEYRVPVSAANATTNSFAGVTLTSVTISSGTINNTTIGATTRSTGAFTTLSVTGTDSTGTPGNVTNNSSSGRAAIAAAATTCVVTNSGVAAADHVLIQPRANDAPTKWAVTTAAGSFTVTVDAAPAATWPFDFIVIKN